MKNLCNRIISFVLVFVFCLALLPQITPEVNAATGQNEQWLWPVEGIYGIGSNYGMRNLDGSADGSREDEHEGIDINSYGSTFGSSISGKPVRAAKSGTIYSSVSKYANNTGTGYGNCVRIDHGDGTYSLYAHLLPTGVRGTGEVKQGDVIGYIGNTGSSGGAHLHFQMYTNKNNPKTSTLNPMPTNSKIKIKNVYDLPAGWPTKKTTYIFELCDHGNGDSFVDKGGVCGVCEDCGYVFDWESTFTAADAGTYTWAASAYEALRPAPYKASGEAGFCPAPPIEVTGSVTNAYGNKWYVVAYGGKDWYVHEDNLELVSKPISTTTVIVHAPAMGQEIVQASYNIVGTVSSNYPIIKIEGYIDGKLKATETYSESSGVKSVSLKDSAINSKIKFADLSLGNHTLTIKVYNSAGSDGSLDISFKIVSAVCGHSYTYKATKSPTTSTTGTLTGTCSKCSGTTTVTLPKLNTTDYSYAIVQAATCTATGVGRYTWKTTTYGTVQFDEPVAVKGHSYTSKVTAPTCTAQGYTTHTCTCGYSYKDTYTSATGHSYTYKATKSPTTSATGTLTGTCSKCSGTTTVTLPKLNTTDYSYAIVQAATCTATGVGRYTWKTTTYGTFKFDTTVAAKGHSYTNKVTAPTCTEPGYTTHTCTCGYSYKDTYTNATGHSYTYKAAKSPTTSTTGTLTGTCSKCSGTTTVTLPKLHTDDYYYKVSKAATCTATGTGTYTWENTEYGTFYFDVTIAAKGHSYSNGKCTVCGVTDPDYNENLPKATVGKATARARETVTVNIVLSGAPNLETLGASDIVYDTNALELVGFEWKVKDAFLSNWDEKEGKGAVMYSAPADLNGTIIALSFKVKDSAADGDYAVSCTVTSQESEFNNVSGKITVCSLVPGDLDGSEGVDKADAIYLMMHIMFSDSYPINQNADFTGDSVVDKADAIYLMMHIMFEDSYPIG